jgi:excisionase family DNA binding protein
MNRDTRFLRTRETAAVLSVDRATVLRLVERGQLKAIRLGSNALRFDIADIEDFVSLRKK